MIIKFFQMKTFEIITIFYIEIYEKENPFNCVEKKKRIFDNHFRNRICNLMSILAKSAKNSVSALLLVRLRQLISI